MRKQNYMTNRKIKEAADKNQKGYVNPEEENQNQIPAKTKYYFKSYSDSNKTTTWGTGSVETTGNISNHFVEVKVLTNTGDNSFINALFFISEDAKTDGTVYQLYSDAGTTGTGIYVEISNSPIELDSEKENQDQNQDQTPQKTKYYFKSYSDSNKTTVWGTGSVETTGNISNDFVEVKVLTNTGDESFIDALFFITKDAKTDGTVYQLYNDAGTTGTGIYVEISSSPIE